MVRGLSQPDTKKHHDIITHRFKSVIITPYMVRGLSQPDTKITSDKRKCSKGGVLPLHHIRDLHQITAELPHHIC